MNSLLILVLFATSMLLSPIGTYAQERGPTKDEIIESNFGGPSYLDSYWTSGSSGQNGTEVDVAPGDGASTLAVVLINRGPSDISGITGRLDLPDGYKPTGKAVGTSAVATFNQIAKVGNPFTLFFDVDVLDNAKVGEYSARLSLDYAKYFETGTLRNVVMDVPFTVTGEAILSVGRTLSNGSNDSQIAAGKIEDFAFKVSNDGTTPLTNVVITIESPSESLKILGDSKWTIQGIEQNSKVDLATRVFAATSLIGDPAVFDVTVHYSANGESKTEKFALGTYVAGDINIKAYDIAIEYIGGSPNIVGSLLNEGNTVGLFTTIEVTSAGNLVSELPPSQYIGDLEENSPLPFSIPININGNAGPGTYPVSLKVSYKDDLRETHTFAINAGLQFTPEKPAEESSQNNSIMSAGMLPVGLGVAAAVAIGVVVAWRRRRKSALKRTFQAGKDNDIESVLDSHNKQERK